MTRAQKIASYLAITASIATVVGFFLVHVLPPLTDGDRRELEPPPPIAAADPPTPLTDGNPRELEPPPPIETADAASLKAELDSLSEERNHWRGIEKRNSGLRFHIGQREALTKLDSLLKSAKQALAAEELGFARGLLGEARTHAKILRDSR